MARQTRITPKHPVNCLKCATKAALKGLNRKEKRRLKKQIETAQTVSCERYHWQIQQELAATQAVCDNKTTEATKL